MSPVKQPEWIRELHKPLTDAEIRAHRLAHMMGKTDRSLELLLKYSNEYGPDMFPAEMLAEYQGDMRAEIARRRGAKS